MFKRITRLLSFNKDIILTFLKSFIELTLKLIMWKIREELLMNIAF